MNQMPAISEAELEVLQVLWKEKKPMKIQDVLDRLEQNAWKYNTVGTLLLRLEAKNAVKSEKSGRVIMYTPLIDEEEYKKQKTGDFVNRLYNGSVKDLAVSLFQSEKMSAEDIEEIRKVFNL